MNHYEIAQMVEELVRIGLDTEAISFFVNAAIREDRRTVPETVQTVKLGMLADGADPEIVAGFFADLDAVASLHIN